jgi:asparagine synthetase B (glutamine-hydrolysing)
MPARPNAEMVAALRHAVKLRLISDVEVGALLSGGVDSSAVVSLMAGLQEAPVSTFSIGFAERDYDESAYAKAVSDRYHTQHHTRIVDPGDFSLLPRLPGIYDEPFGDISALPTFAVCKLARQSVKAALTGDGGDEILGGLPALCLLRFPDAGAALAAGWIARSVILVFGGYLSAWRPVAADAARQDHVPGIVAQSRRRLSAHGVGAAGRDPRPIPVPRFSSRPRRL